MNELIKVNYDTDTPTVSGRELHEALGVDTPYTQWFSRMCEYGFSEGKGYFTKMLDRSDGLPGKPRTDHILTVRMAKELCMLQRTEKGKMFREYFIAVEEAWNSPDMIMERALKISAERTKSLLVENARLTVDNQRMLPKAEYFDTLVDRKLYTGIRDSAKELGVRQTVFVEFLLSNKYLYRSKKGKLLPYAPYVEQGLFVLKEFVNDKTGYTDTQTMLTPKGKETFRLLCI